MLLPGNLSLFRSYVTVAEPSCTGQSCESDLDDANVGSTKDFKHTVSSPETGKGQAYSSLEGLFNDTKRLFSRDRLFLDAHSLHFNSAGFPRTVRKVNLATFVACVFRCQNIPFLELDEAFLDIFMPIGSRLLKSEGALYLELKTQAYIAIMMSGSAKKEDVLERLFPQDLQLSILRRRSEPTHLAPIEQDFISRVNTRRQYLSAGSHSMEALSQLPQKYNWKDFLEEVSSCVRRAIEGIDSGKVCNHVQIFDKHVLTIATRMVTSTTLTSRRRQHQRIQSRRPHSQPMRPSQIITDL